MFSKTTSFKGGFSSNFWVKGLEAKRTNTVGVNDSGNASSPHLRGKPADHIAAATIERHQQTTGMDTEIRVWTSAETPPMLGVGGNWQSGGFFKKAPPGQTRKSRRVVWPDSQQNQNNAAPALLAAPQHQVITADTAAAAALPVAPQPPVRSCLNCGKNTDAVKDCVGPPNSVQDDIPMCPMCDTMDGKNQDHGHQFDRCHLVVPIVARFQLTRGQPMSAAQMQDLTADELRVLFENLAIGRASKTPLRTRHFCWVNVVLEAARREGDAVVARALPGSVPWTKSFAKKQLDMVAPPWDMYGYGVGAIVSLPKEEYPTGASQLRVMHQCRSLPMQVFGEERIDNEYRPGVPQFDSSTLFGAAAPSAENIGPESNTWW